MNSQPQILDIPDKFEPLLSEFDNYRIFLIDGGRYGTKSHSVARFLLYLNDKYNLRTVCAREIQNTIKESVHQLLSDLIHEFQLAYQVQTASIKSLNKDSEFLFIGLREQDRFNIKSFEGADILWIEEGQTLKKTTMDVVLPTIRRPNSKIIVTMNRHVFNDPAYTMLVNRPDCLHINVNYTDLPKRFLSQEILNEIEICRKDNPKDYDHIYLGHPLDQSEDAVFSLSEIENGKAGKHELGKEYGLRLAGFDVARFGDDKCAAVIVQQIGALHWEQVFVDEWGQQDLNYSTGRILQISTEEKADRSVVDEDGLGAGPLDTLRRGRGLEDFQGFRNLPYGFAENKYFGNVRTAQAFKVKELLQKGWLCLNDPKLIEELLTCFKYTFDHYQRRILISKEDMKKKFGVKSPNRADALLMAASLIGEVKYDQERQYRPKVAAQSKESDLFRIAGVM